MFIASARFDLNFLEFEESFSIDECAKGSNGAESIDIYKTDSSFYFVINISMSLEAMMKIFLERTIGP